MQKKLASERTKRNKRDPHTATATRIADDELRKMHFKNVISK